MWKEMVHLSQKAGKGGLDFSSGDSSLRFPRVVAACITPGRLTRRQACLPRRGGAEDPLESDQTFPRSYQDLGMSNVTLAVKLYTLKMSVQVCSDSKNG